MLLSKNMQKYIFYKNMYFKKICREKHVSKHVTLDNTTMMFTPFLFENFSLMKIVAFRIENKQQNLLNGRELSIVEEALLLHSEVTVILDSGRSAACCLTNDKFSQFNQLISWTNFFQN